MSVFKSWLLYRAEKNKTKLEYVDRLMGGVWVYLDLHALLQEPLGLILHLQSGSADEQQIVFNHLDAAQIHTL